MIGPAIGSFNSQRNVLVVEDEFLIAMEMEDLLLEEGFGVVGPAGTVAYALDLLAHQTPDMAVLDVNIGDKRVTPVVLRLRSLGIPFVIASASDAESLATEPIFGERRRMQNPFDRRRLLNAMHELSS